MPSTLRLNSFRNPTPNLCVQRPKTIYGVSKVGSEKSAILFTSIYIHTYTYMQYSPQLNIRYTYASQSLAAYLHYIQSTAPYKQYNLHIFTSHHSLQLQRSTAIYSYIYLPQSTATHIHHNLQPMHYPNLRIHTVYSLQSTAHICSAIYTHIYSLQCTITNIHNNLQLHIFFGHDGQY